MTSTLSILESLTQELTSSQDKGIKDVLFQAIRGIAIVDSNGVFEEMNDAYCEIDGYSEVELKGRLWLMSIRPEDRTRAEVALSKMQRNGKALIELRGIRHNGEEYYKEMTLLRRKEQGEYSGFYSFSRDITDIKHLEERVITLEAKLTQLTNNMRVANASGR